MGVRSKSGRGGRSISAEEAAMWEAVTRALAPVKGKPRVSAPSRPPGAPRAAAPSPEPVLGPATPSAVGPVPALDRRQARLIASGRIAIEARLDLHGCLEREARGRLHAFLRSAQQHGHTTVLVITGKGVAEPGDVADGAADLAWAGSARRRGILRRSVPTWLGEPDVRALVVSFAAAGPRHGGPGAFYVRVRKAAAR